MGDQMTLDQVADQLAIAVGRQWEAEARLHRLNDPSPLPVAWQPADASLVEGWHELVATASGWRGGRRSDPAGWAASPADLAGTGNDLADVLARVPTGRLIVLGEPGAGKTTLLIRLLLDLLARRALGGPVPLLVSLATWNPQDDNLATWLGGRLTLDHPALAENAPAAEATTRVEALLERQLLLPILDGLDELPEQMPAWAIVRLNDALVPCQALVLASRTGAYRHTATPRIPATASSLAAAYATGRPVPASLRATPPATASRRLRGAAGITLQPLAPVDVRAHLCRDAADSTTAARWDRALMALGTNAPIAQALTTPLLVALARTIHNPRPGEQSDTLPDPTDLCDQARFPTRTAIEQHLLDAFIPAVYRPHPDPRRRGRWTAAQAERWLAFLARHLHHDLDTLDIAWWQLHRSIPRPALGLVVGSMAGLLAGLVGGLAAGIATGITDLSEESPDGGLRCPPRGLASALAVALVVGLVTGRSAGLAAGLVIGPMFGYLPLVFIGLNRVPEDLTIAANPPAVLARDRGSLSILAPVSGLAIGLLAGRAAAFVAALLFGPTVGYEVWIAVGIVALPLGGLAFSAWGWFGVARCYLALHRRLPWHLMTFLADAHQRGVLRQAGAVYQFRHAELQRRLGSRSL